MSVILSSGFTELLVKPLLSEIALSPVELLSKSPPELAKKVSVAVLPAIVSPAELLLSKLVVLLTVAPLFVVLLGELSKKLVSVVFVVLSVIAVQILFPVSVGRLIFGVTSSND